MHPNQATLIYRPVIHSDKHVEETGNILQQHGLPYHMESLGNVEQIHEAFQRNPHKTVS